MGGTAAKTVTPGMDIVASMAEEFRAELLKSVEGGVKELTADLDGVRMVDSVGLGVLIAAHNSLQKNDGVFIVINASEDIYKLFKVMRLDRHFEVKMAE
ncbi:anti-sigma B factor antagonist [Desulfosarcina sp. BuS5]|uniref:STAS domain-containing protein n=1 Tax=Desulfosarcina sp. BuS5 TaxID=933262 RepID=UPI000484BC93|nr:STAS domain-containing protein [Desulfosarcina sp. BuS5]WDN88149.1 anti-sigma B factor antagonist [Desulfosarcina sp. BuS5]